MRKIIDDPEASGNDRFVALDLLKNVNISAGGILPMCQDTGTAIVMGKKSEGVITGADDGEWISRGVYDAYTTLNLRYSQNAPLTMFEEKNTGTNLPAQVEIYATEQGPKGPGVQIPVHGQGRWVGQQIVPVPGDQGHSEPEQAPRLSRSEDPLAGHRRLPALSPGCGDRRHIGRIRLEDSEIRFCALSRHAAHRGSMSAHGFRDTAPRRRSSSSPSRSASARSSAANTSATTYAPSGCRGTGVVAGGHRGVLFGDRQALGKITADGVFLEQLETDPAQYMPDAGVSEEIEGGAVVEIDLNRPMPEILAELTKHPVKTRLSLTGPLVVARDIAHAKIKERLDAGEPMPDYLRDHPVYYAGPAKTPEGMASGSFGPTTAGRMDSYVEQFQAAGGSMVMLAKGNRSKQVTDACDSHGGFYLGSIGGPVARLALDCIKSQEIIEYPELGMEAVWKIDVENFPAFIVVDDKGNDFFTDPGGAVTVPWWVSASAPANAEPRVVALTRWIESTGGSDPPRSRLRRRYNVGKVNLTTRRPEDQRTMTEPQYRIEHDTMGEVKVPIDALWRAQTQRAVENFPISFRPLERTQIRAMGLLKAACAQVNKDLGLLDAEKAEAIIAAATEIAAGLHDDQFPIDVFQTGSGTSSNMNANEVIATIAKTTASTCTPTTTSTCRSPPTTPSPPPPMWRPPRLRSPTSSQPSIICGWHCWRSRLSGVRWSRAAART